MGRRDLGNEMGHHTLPIKNVQYSIKQTHRTRSSPTIPGAPEPYSNGYGRFKSNMNRMGLSPPASCECGATDQTAQHIASECPLHSCDGDLVVLDTAARNWLHDLQCVV